METFARSRTARRLWALPGAVLTIRQPQFVDGAVVTLDSSPAVQIPCPSFLIEHDRGLVLFDSGVSPKGLKDPEGYFSHLAKRLKIQVSPDLGVDAQLRHLGYQPKRVGFVIPSHLHFDHAGGLYLFPDATFLIGIGEMPYAYWPPPGAQSVFLIEDLVPTRGFKWIELATDHDLFGDGSVVILRTPGHTPGEVSLLVRLPNRRVILTGDTCHFRIELEHGIPIRGACVDQMQGIQSIRLLQMLRTAHDAQIWINHDPQDWAMMPHAPQSID